MKTETQKDFSNFFDLGPEEPNLCTLPGYDCYEDCYFMPSTLKREQTALSRYSRRD